MSFLMSVTATIIAMITAVVLIGCLWVVIVPLLRVARRQATPLDFILATITLVTGVTLVLSTIVWLVSNIGN